MKSPTINNEIGGYLLTWQDGLNIRIKRLHVHSDGRVTGDLTVKNNNGTGEATLLPSSQFNFSSETTRSRLAKQLNDKYEVLKINWVEVLDYLGDKIQELARGGEEVSEVWLQDDIKAPELLLSPFIYRGVSNVIFGEKGVNKSTLVYLLGVCLALPWADNPLELTVSKRPLKTLVLDWETNKDVFEWYLSRLKRGMQIPECNLFYRQCRLSLAEEIEAIETYLKTTGAELLVVDSLAAAAGGESSELKGSQQALQFNSALRKLKTTALIIAQTSKDTESKHKTIYGSGLFTYYARNIFELCRPREDSDPDNLHLAVFHRENNFGPKSRPMGISVSYQSDQGISMKREPISVAEFAEKVGLRVRMLDFLKSGKKTVKEIVESLDITENSARVNLSALKKQGKIIKVEDGYGLLIKDDINA